jgi:transposase
LIKAFRGSAKSYGQRLPKRIAQQVGLELAGALSGRLGEVVEPLLREIESLNERIREYDQRIEQMARDAYPEIALLKQVKGVGTPTWHRAQNRSQRVRVEGWRQRRLG